MFSVLGRLIFQSVSKSISLQLEEEFEREVWDSLKADSWALLGSKSGPSCYEMQRKRAMTSDSLPVACSRNQAPDMVRRANS